MAITLREPEPDEPEPALNAAMRDLVANDFLDETEARAEQAWLESLAGKVVSGQLSLDQAADAIGARAQVVGQRARLRGVKAP